MDNILKPSAAEEYHMEMTEMLNQFDKLPNLGNQETYNNFSEIEFSGGSSSSTESAPPNFHNSFINSPVQETMSRFLSPTFHTPQSIEKTNSMREMMFQMAAMQPIQIDPESVKPPQRRNVKISKDPQSVAARHRRERISEKIRILQRLVPGGTKMDTASMLDEAVHYIKFLKKQVQTLERTGGVNFRPIGTIGYPVTSNMNMNYSGLPRSCQPAANMVGSMQMLS